MTNPTIASVKAITWKENKVISIGLQGGTHVLAQLGPAPYLTIFNLFAENDDWPETQLRPADVLFCHAVTRQFLKRSVVVEQKSVKALQGINYPKLWISEDPGSHRVKLWENTSDELEFITLGKGGASLIENDITVGGVKENKTIIAHISPDDATTIDEHELISIAVYPEFNERLLLCSQFKRNVDPAKDLLFNRTLPGAYRRYFQIISGQVPLDELDY